MKYVYVIFGEGYFKNDGGKQKIILEAKCSKKLKYFTEIESLNKKIINKFPKYSNFIITGYKFLKREWGKAK